MDLIHLLYCAGVFTTIAIRTAYSGKITKGILITAAKRPNMNAAIAIKTTHLFIVPVTPEDFVQNHTLISKTLSLSNDKAPLTKFASCDFDYMSDIIYLYDQQTSSIIALNKFHSIAAFHKGVSRNIMVSISVDWVSHNVYWTDPVYGWIAMQPGNPKVKQDQYKIIIDNLAGPRAIAVAPISGYMFYSDVGVTAKIERATLTGDERTVIISQNVLHPVDIEIDVDSSAIVWADEQRDTIETADFNGLNRRIIRRQPHSTFFDVGVFRDILGVVDLKDGQLKFIDKVSGDIRGKSIESQTQAFYGVGIYSAETQQQQLNQCILKGCSDMCISELKQAYCACREGFKLNQDSLTCSEDTGSFHRGLVLAFTDRICIKDFRTINTPEHLNKTCYPTTKDVHHMDLDSWERKFIYAFDDGIYAGSIGKQAQRLVLVSEPITGLSLDWTDKNIYWTVGAENGSIMAFSQQTLTPVAIHDKTLSHPRSVRVLPLKRKLVWIIGIQGSSQILMSNVDGTDSVVIIDSESLIFPNALTVDVNENFLFWSDNGYIRRCKIDGSAVTTMHLSISGMPMFMEPYKGYFVFSSDLPNAVINTILVNSPFTQQQMLHTGTQTHLGGIKILDTARQPIIANPCNVLNGGCEHICLYTGNERVCECNFGFELDINGQTCSAESLGDDFIIVADWTHNEVYQVSMVTHDVTGIDVDGIEQPAAVAYNHKAQQVIWGESTTKQIKSAYIDGRNYTSLLDTSVFGSHPDRFAIDFTSGNIFYTSVNVSSWGFAGVGVLTPSGKHKKLIMNGLVPRDIVVDPEAGLLFWTDHNPILPFVKRANMDGTDITTIVTANIRWPNGLAIDYAEKKLYLTDGLYNTIQRCDYDGQCELIYNDTAAHMMDIDLMGDYLYFTAWNRPYIAKMHKTNVHDFTKLIERAELGRLDSISVFSSKEMNNPVSQACLSNDGLGECSTLCLPTATGFSCACEDGVKLLADQRTCENGTASSLNPASLRPTTSASIVTQVSSTKIKQSNHSIPVSREQQHTTLQGSFTTTRVLTTQSVKLSTTAITEIVTSLATQTSSRKKQKPTIISTRRGTIWNTHTRLGTTVTAPPDVNTDTTTASSGTKKTTQGTSLSNNSLPLTESKTISWWIPFVICLFAFLLIGLVVILIIHKKKRKTWSLQRSESARSSTQGLTYPMYENLLRDEQLL